MDWLKDLFTNPFLLTGVSSWFIAQVLKTILHLIMYKKLEFERLVGDGGMPSGHSATVASLATICGLICGFGSVEFAIAGILAIIVCHDATGMLLRAGFRVRSLHKKRSHPEWDDFFFGDPERTRTVDLQRDRLAC